MHDRRTREPIPDHISARAEDLRSLIEGIIAYDRRSLPGRIDPVVAAAACSFGFGYVHPFEDGNGRLHRWLIHHVLATAGYNPTGVVFPVSAAILRESEQYRMVLESYSRPLLEFIEWEATATGNVHVKNDTANYYRYFDATAHAEFLYRCVEQTIEHDLPDEVNYLQAYDRFSQDSQAILDMPTQKIDLIHHFLQQGQGQLSKRARTKEFSALTDAEIKQIELLYAKSFGTTSRRSYRSRSRRLDR
jgi:Fic family protein